MSTDRMPFDLDDAMCRVMMVAGASLAAVQGLGDGKPDPVMTQMSYENAAFLKALCALGRNHRLELARHWRQALTEPMPFGGAPLGADYHPPPK